MKKARQITAGLLAKVFARLREKDTPSKLGSQSGFTCHVCHRQCPNPEEAGQMGKLEPVCEWCAIGLEEGMWA